MHVVQETLKQHTKCRNRKKRTQCQQLLATISRATHEVQATVKQATHGVQKQQRKKHEVPATI